jgi:hypothetical protein
MYERPRLVASEPDGAGRSYRIRRGERASLMFRDRPELGVEVPDRRDGFGTRDWLIGSAARIQERADPATGFAPRGADVEAGAPAFPFTLNERDRVWAANVASLYDQATAQQWDASTDIRWDALPQLPNHLERAVAQVMTHLAENEYAARYVPARFIPRIHPHFSEVVLFLSTQITDEARHIEAFTKRALANGAGLGRSAAITQQSLKSLLEQEDFSQASFLLSVLGEGAFLDYLSFVERYAPGPGHGGHRPACSRGRGSACRVRGRSRPVLPGGRSGSSRSAARRGRATGRVPFPIEWSNAARRGGARGPRGGWAPPGCASRCGPRRARTPWVDASTPDGSLAVARLR